MKKKYLLLSFLLINLISKAAIHNIYLSCTGITPATMSAICGDTIKWVWGGCSDSITSTTIPSCTAAWNFPVNSTTGTYQAVVPCAGTYNYRCLGFTGVINVTCTATSITQPAGQASEITIYPNPSGGSFSLKKNQLENVKLKEVNIYNVLGECVYQSDTTRISSSSDFQIDLSSQPNGIYFVSIRSEKGTETKKIIIRK